MAIQMRHGLENDFLPEKMLPGEMAVTTDSKKIFVTFSPGDCKQMATYEDMESALEEVETSLDTMSAMTNQVASDADLVTTKAEEALEAAEQAQAAAERALEVTGVDIATVAKAGIVKPDGTTLDVAPDGTMSAKALDSYAEIEANTERDLLAGALALKEAVTYLKELMDNGFNGYTLGDACEKSVTGTVTSGSGSLMTSGGVYTALENKFNGYTLGDACEKSVTTSVTSGSGSLITSGGVYTALKKANIVPAADNTYQLGGDNYNYKAIKTRKVVSNSALELRSGVNLSLYTGSANNAMFAHGQDLRIVSYDSSEDASSITYANCYAKAFTQQSSKRYKDYIRDITDEDAEAVLELNPVIYDYKNPENGRNCEGLFAEDVVELVPYAVSYDENGLPEGLDYSKLIPRLIKLVQTLDSRVKALEKGETE